MNTVVATQEVVKWDNEFGIFEATLRDGKVTEVRMCKEGSNAGDGESLWATKGCEPFLREIHKCLGELLEHIEKDWRNFIK